MPPSTKPIAAGSHGNELPLLDSIAGCNNDQKLAAIIIPAAKPCIEFKTLSFTFLNTNTAAAQVL